MNKLISSCCKAKLWLCGSSRKYPKLDANDPDNEKKVERGRTYYYECDKCKQECDAIGETLEIKNNKWISVKDRLPENHEIVIAVIQGFLGEIPYISLYSEGYFRHLERVSEKLNVIYWMPLPKPPKDNE